MIPCPSFWQPSLPTWRLFPHPVSSSPVPETGSGPDTWLPPPSTNHWSSPPQSQGSFCRNEVFKICFVCIILKQLLDDQNWLLFIQLRLLCSSQNKSQLDDHILQKRVLYLRQFYFFIIYLHVTIDCLHFIMYWYINFTVTHADINITG